MPPAKRKGWDQLSPSYRARLGRAGVSQRDYESGHSLASARGHGRTPERPVRALRHPTRYPEYITKRGLSSADTPVDPHLVDALLQQIHNASDIEARTTLRETLERQSGSLKIRLSELLGIEISVPGYHRLPVTYKVRIAELWLRAFMTHARAESEPMLAGERYIMKGGPREVEGIIGEARKLGYRPRISAHDFWAAFKSSYHQFFTVNRLPGV